MKYRSALPQMAGTQMITDGGLETTLIFQDGIDLPLFAAFKALETDEGIAAMSAYMRRFAELALREKRGFLMDTPTWRASAKWASELGMSSADLRDVHREAVATLLQMRETNEQPGVSPFVVNGVIGPNDDGYAPNRLLSVEQAERYHSAQVGWFAEFGADLVSAVTMTYADEAIGIVRAARAADIPVSISFTVETDGRLPSEQALGEAIEMVDEATDGYAAYFMINCAHPDHFADVLVGPWTKRVMGLRANASRLSHAELDEAEELDDGNPVELGDLYAGLSAKLPNLSIVGGCCGTDHRHVAEMCRATKAA